jgi:hypothetical protein
MHCRSWRKHLLLPHTARHLQHDVDVLRRVLARRSTSADGSWGLQQTSHTGSGRRPEGLPRRFVHRQSDTERQGMSVKLPTPRHSVADRYLSAAAQTAHLAAPAGAGAEIVGTPTVPRPGGAVARATSRQPALAAVSNSSTLQPGRASRVRDADLADRDSAEELAGELDDDHVLACLPTAAWPGRAARHAEHRYPTGRWCAPGHTASRQGGHSGQADRLLAPGLLPLLLPGQAVPALRPTAGPTARD